MQIRVHGTRSWLFRYSRGGTNQWMGLGSTDEKPLSEARDEAAMLRVLVKRGEDPIASKRQVEAKRKIEMKPKAILADLDQFIPCLLRHAGAAGITTR